MLKRAALCCVVRPVVAASSARADLTITSTQTLSPRLTQYTATSDAMGGATNLRVLLPEGYAERDEALPRAAPAARLLRRLPLVGRQGPRRAAHRAVPADRRDARRRQRRLVQRPVQRGRVRPAALRDVRVRRAAAVGRRDVPLDRPPRGRGAEHGRLRRALVRRAPPGRLRRRRELQRRGRRARVRRQRLRQPDPGRGLGPARHRARPLARAQPARPRRGPARPEAARAAHRQRQPGPLDTRTGRDNLEFEVWRENAATARAASTELAIPHVYDDYGPGVHDWPYWARDLERTLRQPRARSSRTTRGDDRRRHRADRAAA